MGAAEEVLAAKEVKAEIEVVTVEEEVVKITTNEVQLEVEIEVDTEVANEAETETKTVGPGKTAEDEVVTGNTTGMPETRTTKTSKAEETDRTIHTIDNSQTTSPTPRLLNKNDDGRPVNLRRATTPPRLPRLLNSQLNEDDST